MSSFESLEFRGGFAGGCYVNGTSTCVAEPEEYCDEGTFVMASYVRANKGHPLRYCAGELENVVIGRCGDTGECSNTPYGCEDEFTWDGYDETCTVTTDLAKTELTYVTYGKCDDRCVWSPNDCIEGEEYIRKSPECTADKVQIGACFDGHAFCAVSFESCTQSGRQDEPFYTHQEVQDKIGANCFLSSLPSPPTTAPPSRSPWTRSPAAAPTPSAFGPADTSTSPPKTDNSEGIFGSAWKISSGLFQSGGFVAIVAVVAVILGIIIGVSAVYCSRRNDNDDSWKADKEHPPVPTEIIDSTPEVEYAASSITDFDVGY